MASITAPNSLQIRLAFSASNSTKFPVFLYSRFPHFNRPRLRLFCVANNGNGSDTLPARVGSDGSPGSEVKKKDSYNGGVVGVGVAGILLLSGLVFAALFASRRKNAIQMKPLTTHQEVLLSSDDPNNEIELVTAGNREEQGNGNVEGQVDVSRDCSSPESDKIPVSHRIIDDSNVGSRLVYDIHNKDNDTDGTTHITVQEEFQHGSAANEESVPHEGTMAFIGSESENPVDSLDSNGFRDFDSSTAKDKQNSITELEENSSLVEPRKVSNFDAEPLPVISEQQDEITDSSGNRSSGTVADNESVLVNIAVSTQSNKTTSDPEVIPEDFEESAQSVSAKKNLELNIPQVLDLSSLAEQSVSENDPFKKSFVSSTDTFIDEQDRNDNDEVDICRSETSNSGAFYSAPGIPVPSAVSSAVQVLPGKVLVPAAVDQVQGQALAALQALKVIESDVQPSDLCTRREYARWLVSASSALSRKAISKVYPAMYIDNVTELAFDDITPEDPDFSSIQGLAEAGLLESRLSRCCDRQLSADEDYGPFYFSPESPLSRQNLVSWKIVLEKRQLPQADRKMLYQLSGFIDTDKIHSYALPALVADVSAGDNGIIALAFGYTRLFQPHKPVTKAQAAIALASGDAFDKVNEELARIEAESMAENAVASHSGLVAQLEKDINASFEQKLSIEREKINAVERMAEEGRCKLESLRAEREEDGISLIKDRAAIKSERDAFSRLRHEVEDQIENLVSDLVEIAHAKDRIAKLRELAEVQNKEITRLQYEVEVERKALSMARAWAEDVAKRVREDAVGLERTRDGWERNESKVTVDVDGDLHNNSAGVTLAQVTVDRAEILLGKLRKMAVDVGGRAKDMIDNIINIISQFVSRLREWQAQELRFTIKVRSKASGR